MPKEFSRSQRMAEQIRRELSELVREEIKDPRVSWVSFTAVKVSKDISSAVVYFTLMDDSQHSDAEQALNNAAGFLRRHLSSRIRSRIVPTLKFFYDASLERGSSMDALIAKARSSDPDSEPDSD